MYSIVSEPNLSLLIADYSVHLAPMQMDIFELFDGFYTFTAMFLIAMGVVALASRTMTIPAYAVFLFFAVIATETQDTFLINILYVALVMVFVGMSFKIIRFEGWGGGADI